MVLVEQDLNHFPYEIQAVYLYESHACKFYFNVKILFIFREFIQINFVSAFLRSTDLCSNNTIYTLPK